MSAGVPVGYRQTEIGVIPEDWDVCCLGDLGDLKMGRGLLKSDISPYGDIPAIPYTSLYTDFSEVIDLKDITWFTNREGAPYIVDSPCVLLASSSNVAANTGKACALTAGFPVAVGREVISFRTNQNVEFISYLLGTRFYRKKTLDLAKGITIRHVYPATFINYEIALPSFGEQSAIAKALGDVNALISSLDQLIAKKRNIKQATMQQLLTGQTRLPGFSGKWEVKRLGDVVEIRKGQLITEKTVMAGDIPVIAGGKKPAYFHNTANRKGKTITVSASGASAGYVAFFDSPIFASDCSTISEGDGYSIEFIYYQLQLLQEQIYKAQTGGAQPHIHAVDLIPLTIGYPSYKEQVAIAEVLSETDSEICAVEARRDKAKQIKQGMMQELLTGRIRLV